MTSTRVVFTSIPDNLKRAIGVMESSTVPAVTPRKRQRLTHLSPEEKMLRRKLKNRVAAQTARDRKKAHMDTIEEALEVTQLAQLDLQDENNALREENERLVLENQELRMRLGLATNNQVEEIKTDKGVAVIKKEVGSPESAALNAPLQQSDMLLGLLENFNTKAPGPASSVGQDSLEASPVQDVPYPVVGPSAEELESLKELIRFDHEYVKRPPVPTPVTDIEQEKRAPTMAKPKALALAPALAPAPAPAPAPVVIIDVDDDEDEAVASPPPTEMDFGMELFPGKAGAALQDMLVSLKSASLAVSTDVTAVPNLLSIEDDSGVFDCDFSALLSVGSDDAKHCDSRSESGRSEVGSCVDSAFGETPGSPFSDYSDMSPNLGDNIWEESFTDLFPSLDYL